MNPAPPLGPTDVLEFWFGTQEFDDASYREGVQRWFFGSAETDEEIRTRFGQAVQEAAAGAFDHWAATARGSLALILLLDQFPRNIYRGQPEAYAFDAFARDLCIKGLEQGFDRALSAQERPFYFLPLQHSESRDDQDRCVALFHAELEATTADDWFRPHAEHAHEVAIVHARIIHRYGRYPHRNEVLQRPTTLDERMYLDAGGPAFGQETRPAEPKASHPRFEIYRSGLDPTRSLCVDGFVVGLRCLSHWPGANPPPQLAHDLSTGMALRWARLDTEQRERIIGPFSVVTNDHYDTDGVLAAFALIRPQLALTHADRMVRAATTGDFRTWNGEDALAVDLTIWALRDAPRSPLSQELAAVDDYESRAELCYRYALDHLDDILRDPFAFRHLWSDRFDRIMADLRRVESGDGVSVRSVAAADLAIVESNTPLSRVALIHAAAEHSRVLAVLRSDDGPHYRFLYRNESWFVGLRDRLPPRRDLTAAVAELQSLETSSAGRWWASTLEQTSPQLGFGDIAAAADIFGDLRPDLDPPSSLSVSQVTAALCSALANDIDRPQLHGAL